MIDRLRKSFAQVGNGRPRIDFLPLALLCANDLPGPISGIPPTSFGVWTVPDQVWGTPPNGS